MTAFVRRISCFGIVVSALLLGAAGSAGAATLPSGFQESSVISGLINPVKVEFANDGRIFVAEKSGVIKVYDNLSDTTPTTFADLRTNVHNFWDRGMLGMALSPNFPADPSVYVLYTYDNDPNTAKAAPEWGSPGVTSDGCPTPPGATADGCVVMGRLSKLTANGNVSTGNEQVLIEDWCQQYPSHTIGDLEFGADGKLYVSGGDGASFNFTDWGQDGSPVNPCGDPGGTPAGQPGSALSPPAAEGGALRSQDVRTGGAGGGPGGGFQLRPNTDVTSQWVVAGGASTAWDALDDNVTQPFDIPAESFLYDSAQGATTEVGLSSANLGGGTPSSGKAWFYMDTAPGQTVRADVIWGGQVRATKNITSETGTDYQWHSIDVVPPTQAAVDDLRLRFTISTAGTSSADIFAAYFELTTQGTTSTDPHGLAGTILRVDPATGAGLPDNPMGSSSDPNARRMVAYGLRNPFRFGIRPGTNEVWAGDVGWGTWEEINRVVTPTDAQLDNFGWPCYEGADRQPGYDGADLNLCESLFSGAGQTGPTGGGNVAPYFAWNHAAKVVSGEGCPTGGSSISGIDFYTGGPYPADYDGAMIFADYSRDCIWVMKTGGGTLPSTSAANRITFIDGASNPVDVTVGPDGNIYYPDFDGGTIRRVNFTAAGQNQPPTAVASANPTSGAAPLDVQFNGAGSTDPDQGDTLSYAWDLDGDGQFDDSTAVNPTRTYSAGTHTVRLQVSDGEASDTSDPVTINAGNTAPTASINTPSSSTLWQVGQAISFSGSASDTQDGAIPASRLSWQLDLQHCPTGGPCHTHTVQSYSGVSSGSFVGPDHEYPSHLVLRLTATDSGGLSHTVTRQLNPRTVGITMTTSPSALNLIFNGTTSRATFTRTVIQGSRNTISAPTPQRKSGKNYSFSRWSDGGARTHDIFANASTTLTATFVRGSGASASALCEKKAKKKGKKKKKKRC